RPGRRSDSPHDVDLCLVSPCEFEHPKSERSPSAAASPRELSDSDPSQELVPRRGHPHETPPTSVSESLPTLSDSDIPPATEDCPSILADGLESDEDSEQPPRGTARARDPLPAPMKDPCPIPAQPGICMVDPEALPAGKKETSGKVKRTPSRVGSTPTAAKAEPPRHPTLTPKVRGPAGSARDAGDKAKVPLGDKKGPSVGDTRTPGSTRSAGARLPTGA
ncbi:MAP1S protein, partial [Brachypteracias leptosomus]|nr:MAP1S protein [Brachypteracias leptosomus]